MTDRGNIGACYHSHFARKQVSATPGVGNALVTNSGIMAGIVQIAGVPVGGAIVRLHHRATGLMVDSVVSAADGSFVFYNLDPKSVGAFYAVAFDPVGGDTYDALVLDQLTPVPNLSIPSRAISTVGAVDDVFAVPYLVLPAQSLTFTNTNVLTLSADHRTAGDTTNAQLGWYQAWNPSVVKNSGKWYYELTINNKVAAESLAIGMCINGASTDNAGSGTKLQYFDDGRIRTGGNYFSYGASWVTGDVIGVFVDLNAKTISFAKNGVSQGVAFTTANGLLAGGSYFMCFDLYHNSGSVYGSVTLADHLAYPNSDWQPLV